MTTEQRDKMRAIGKTLSDAMAARADCDWTRDTPITVAAQVNLDEAVTQFVFETGTREQVRATYKQYAEMHVR